MFRPHLDQRLRLGVATLTLALALLGALPASAASIVQASSSGFTCGGSPYQFIGVNLATFTYNGGELYNQLYEANRMNARVVRVFIAHNDKTPSQIQQQLQTIIDTARSINPEMKLIVSLTDFYHTGYSPQGDDGYYEQRGCCTVLSNEWFRTGYTVNYKPMVGQLVSAFASAPEIFAWELGNELSAGSGDDMLAFAYDMGSYIKSLGAQQMVTTGFISSNHAANGVLGGRTLTQMIEAFYSSWNGTPSPFDFVSIHGYNNEWKASGVGNASYDDYNWARSRKPYVVGEIGFSGSFDAGANCHLSAFGGDFWDGIYLPDATASRTDAIRLAVDHFFAVGADGVMNWGFMAGTQDTGFGDRCFGIDQVFHNDWSGLFSYYQGKGAALPGCGSGPQPQGNDAQILRSSSSVPSALAHNERRQVTIRVQNTGGTTWQESFPTLLYRLKTGSANSVAWDNWSCGGYANSPTDSRAYVCGQVAPGSATDFTFDIIAPPSGTTAYLSVQMIQDDVSSFGTVETWQINLGSSSCGTACTQCVLNERPDVLTNYGTWGWDTSCGGRDAIVDDWCTNLAPGECSDVKTGACSIDCNVTTCGEPCSDCILTARPDVLSNYELWGWDPSCSNRPAIVDDWCTNLAPDECAALENGQCTQACGTTSCGNACAECVLTQRPDVLSAYEGWGWSTACVDWPLIVDDWCANLDPAACTDVKQSFCPSECNVTQPPVTQPTVLNAGFESNPTPQFGGIGVWTPGGAWAYHAQFAAPGNSGLGASFAYYAAGTTESFGQILTDRFAANTTYTFRSWAIGGGDRTGQVPYQIGYAAVDGDISSFVPLATNVVNLTGNTSWVETNGVSYTTGSSGAEVGQQIIVRFGSSADGGSSDIWLDNVSVIAGTVAAPTFSQPLNPGIEDNPTPQFGGIGVWTPGGGWAYHSNFPAAGNSGLGASFGYYAAGTAEHVDQLLSSRFSAGRTYTFKSWAIGGGNQIGQVPYQIGYAAVDGDVSSFVPLATNVIDLTGNTSWTETAGVSYTTGSAGPELGQQIIVRFGNVDAGGSSDIWFDDITVTRQ